MKKAFLFIVLSVMLVALGTSALAQLQIPTEATVGSDSTARGQNVTFTFKVKNTLAVGVTDVTLAFSAIDAKFRPTFSNSTIASIAAGEESPEARTITLFVPFDLPATDNEGNVIVNTLGTVTVSGKNSTGQAIQGNAMTLKMKAENKLEIDDIIVTVNGEENSVDDGDDVKDIKPLDQICVQVTAKSLFTDDDNDPDINSVDAAARSKDSSKFSYSDSDDIGDLGADEDDSVTLKCEDIDEDADGTIRLEVFIIGTTDSTTGNSGGARMGDRAVIDLKVDRERHDVKLERVELRPNRITTDAKSIELVASLFNSGKDDEDTAGFSVSSEELDISAQRFDIALDESKKTTKSIVIPLSNLKVGTYTLTVKSSYSASSSETDSKTIQLVVTSPQTTSSSGSSGSSSSGSTTTSGSTVGTTTGSTTGTTGPTVVSPPVVKPAETSSSLGVSNSTVYLGGLAVVIVVIVVLIVLLLAVALRK